MMITRNAQRHHGGRIVTAIGAAAAVAVVLAGCSASAETPADNGSSSSPSSANSALADEVQQLTQPLDAYPMPTEAVTGVSELAGGTIYYVPITLRAPQFAVTQAGIEAAAAAAGLKVQVCDGQGNPTGVSSCIDQATQAKAIGVVTDGLPYDLAANSIDAAQSAGIPVIISNQIASDRHPVTPTLAYVPPAGSEQLIALSKWITLDSDGAANILFNRSTDGEAQKSYVQAATTALPDFCPSCTATVYDVSSANFAQIPASTSSELLKNPDIDYIVSEFAEYLHPASEGVQQAGLTGKVKMLAAASALSNIEEVSKGGLATVSAQAAAYQGWVDLDAVLRLIAGQELPEYTIPIRLFTPESAKDVTLTAEAEQSGEWFGPTTFTDDFKKLWAIA
ncbi:sugar ABC transporter substrate-binding protein [Leifsonia sp. A12D58]|uniref:sugar ABC transporter substrate-binding protein n=1 Tax=Leifsonia sp. A12D58 TaxID=3397674 RepID=UPI0039E037F1